MYAIFILLSLCTCSFAFTLQRSSYNIIRNTKLFNSKSKEVEIVNADNNEKVTLPAGSPLSLAAARTGLRLSFQCKEGSCGSCELFLDNKRVRSCVTKIPDRKKIIIKKAPQVRQGP